MIFKLLLVILIFLISQVLMDYQEKHTFTDYLEINSDEAKRDEGSLEKDIPADAVFTAIVDNDGILSVQDIHIEDGELAVTMTGQKIGSCHVTIVDETSGKKLSEADYLVSSYREITNRKSGNFANSRLHSISVTILMIALALLMFYGFFQSWRKVHYSYQAIFYCGFFIWLCNIILVLIIKIYNWSDMLSIYRTIQQMGIDFMLLSAPFILIFSIALSISNLSLIRHEGFRVQNVLGIAISCCMILGAIIGIVLYNRNIQTGVIEESLYDAFVSIYSSLYCLGECFLIGSVICGILAAKHEPALDKDYIIILGCRVKKDGGLYPLVKGRVDRAIAFYEKQLEVTGKKAVFVPSGGKGSDEQMSEGDAMGRYLREQGFGESQILVENKSINTKENMIFSKRLIDEDFPQGADAAKVAFATTNYHVFRSGIISRQNDFQPDGMGCKTKWYFWPNAYIREVIGMMAYLWKRIVLIMIPILAFNFIIQFVF